MQLELGKFDAESDPGFHEFTELAVVSELFFDGVEIYAAHELGSAPALSGEVELVVRAVFFRRIRLAAAVGFAADVVLLGQATGSERAERSDFLFDLFDPAFQGS